jgi:hypothetical protein
MLHREPKENRQKSVRGGAVPLSNRDILKLTFEQQVCRATETKAILFNSLYDTSNKHKYIFYVLCRRMCIYYYYYNNIFLVNNKL